VAPAAVNKNLRLEVFISFPVQAVEFHADATPDRPHQPFHRPLNSVCRECPKHTKPRAPGNPGDAISRGTWVSRPVRAPSAQSAGIPEGRAPSPGASGSLNFHAAAIPIPALRSPEVVK